MATIQLGNTKVASKLISYAEKKSVERDGIDCDPEYAKSQFKATRELYGKTEGVQSHHVIQSFKPGEVTPKLANQIGKDLAKVIAKGHEVAIYTHADKEHIHNHIVINSVNHENGKKYQCKKSDLYKIREQSDNLCKERGLSVVKEPSAKQRYHRAEYGMAKRGEMSWKDEIREVIDREKIQAKSYDEFKHKLTDKYGIEVKERGKNISFKHPDHQKFVRGKTLGLDYERGTIENGFDRQIERGRTTSDTIERTRGITEGNERPQQPHAELHKSSHERGHSKENDIGSSAKQNNKHEQRNSRKDNFDITKAREHAEGLWQQTSSSYGDWKERNEPKQSKDINQNDRDRTHARGEHERNGKELKKQLERVRTKDFFPSR